MTDALGHGEVMKILYSDRGQLTQELWDELVEADPRGHLLQTWAWGQLKQEFGWHVVRIAVGMGDIPVLGAQVLYRRLGPLVFGYIPRGPVMRDGAGKALPDLWSSVHRHARKMGAVFLKVEPECFEEELARGEQLLGEGFVPSLVTIQPRCTVVVDLTPDPDTILARMKSKWRYNIRLSIRRGVEVTTVGRDELPTFYRLMQITAERDGFGIHKEQYYHRAWELFAPQGRACLLMAYYQGEPLAGLMVFACGQQAWYMYGASSNAHRSLMPNHQLQWRAMCWAKSKGCTSYDLWGIADSDPDSPTAALQGVERFKRGFGGRVVRYIGAYDRPYSRLLYSLFLKAWSWRKRRLAHSN